MPSTLYDDPTRLQSIFLQTLSIVAYTFLYIFASGIACLLGVALSRLYDHLLLRNKWRGFSDWDSTTQSLCVLISVLGFLTTAECLFALHLFGRVDLVVTEQIAVALFGILVFGVACTGVFVVVALVRGCVGLVLGRVGGSSSETDASVRFEGKRTMVHGGLGGKEDQSERSRMVSEWDPEAGIEEEIEYEEEEEEEDEDDWNAEPYQPGRKSIKMRKMPFVKDYKKRRVLSSWVPSTKTLKKKRGGAAWIGKIA